MINIWTVLLFLAIHWIADFIFQTNQQAQNKSKSWEALLNHTSIYSIIWIPVILIMHHNLMIATFFSVITFISHTTTDYFTSRVNSKLWSQQRVHAFFVSIGFDQLLHFVQLFLTYYLLTKQNG